VAGGEKVQGFSRSLWKSTAVKSIRLGWPAGFHRTRDVLGRSVNWRDLLLAQVFEDLWPSRDQLPEVLDEVQHLDVDALCRRDPHHGERRLSQQYADIAPEVEGSLFRDAGRAAQVGAEARAWGLNYLGPRSLSEFAIWSIADPPPGGTRSVDEATWQGVPPAMADLHTREGRRRGTMITILCGHPDGHVGLMHAVDLDGWAGVRGFVHGEPILPGEIRQDGLFDTGGQR
jgi:hypothetical protein